ncbi:transporter, partial [Acidithiobacillus ferridurans]
MNKINVFPITALLATLIMSTQAVRADDAIQNPCTGPSALLALLDRPTVSDSACVVQDGQAVLEAGYQHANLTGAGGGTADNFPEAELRFGLPGNNEFVLLPPNDNVQRTPSDSTYFQGFSATTVGIKHELGYTKHWLGAVESLFTLPSGSPAFGSRGTGVAFNGIVTYAPSDDTGISLQLGVTSQTNPALAGGGRFTSINPDITFTWSPLWNLQFYGEAYGQSRTGPGLGSGFDADGGVQYLLTPYCEVDLEEGARLSGNLGGFTHYFGAGMG